MRVVKLGYFLFLLLVVGSCHSSAAGGVLQQQDEDEEDSAYYHHREPPTQLNVYNDPFCQVDENGFGGFFSETSFRINYYQEIEFLSTTTSSTTTNDTTTSTIVDGIVRDLELSIVNLLLKSNQVLCGTSTQKQEGEQEEEEDSTSTTGRGLLLNSRKIIGISTNPDDQVLESCECVVASSSY